MAICTTNPKPTGLANRYESIILGAGISGLALAWRLEREGCRSLLLIEESERVGGWIETSHVGGMLFERGPRSCRSSGHGQATLQLAREVGLEERIIRADEKAKIRYLWQDGKLHPLPHKPHHLLNSPLLKGVRSTLWKERRRPIGTAQEESIATFATRRFSKEVAERFFDPFTTGIYGGEIDHLSIHSCFPTLVRWEREYGSVLKGLRSERRKEEQPYLFSFLGGMEELPQAIARSLQAPIWTSSPAIGLRFDPSGVEVVTPHGAVYADRLFSTLPARALAPLLPELSPLLLQIPSLSMRVVSLGYQRQVLSKRGFGYLIPRREGEEILGAVWDSAIFPQHNMGEAETRITVMISGEGDGAGEIACRALRRHLGIKIDPDLLLVREARHAIPQYTLGHADRLKKIENLLIERYPQLTLLGASYYGVSVNECISKTMFKAS
jgi:protoporphyrinogen/coproporphyrinogen III oxidase